MITFAVNSVPTDLEDLQDKDLDVIAKVHREKRSLNANSYFHVLSGKIAEKAGTSLSHEKNRLIREYGQYEYIDGMIPTITVNALFEDKMLDMEGVHLKVIERPGETVKMAFLRGSHTYNTAEMSRLIDAAVEEAKELGVETMTPEQLERMKAAWKERS
jgi:hypothetical protein